MSFIRYKQFGNQEYAYEITSYWDPKLKKPRQKTKYRGVVIDKKKGIFEKKQKQIANEKLILDFGDAYLLYEFMKSIKLIDLFERVFGDYNRCLTSLVFYKLCHPSAMNYAKIWYEGSITRYLFNDIDLSSQRISEFLESIGDEHTLRNFFKDYIKSFTKPEEGVIIDTTSLPNQIHFPFNMWGYNDGSIDKQIRFLFVIDKNSLLPLFFRYMPGSIVDVSTLNTTMEECKKYGIKNSFALIDSGFYSENNIKGLFGEHVEFLIRLPSNRIVYKNLIKQDTDDIENFSYAVRYGERALFVKEKEIPLYGKKAYAYIILDPERKGRETKKLLLDAMEDLGDKKEIDFKLKKKGIMILISSFRLEREEVVPVYYIRQTVERLFGFSKDDLKLVPLRVHKEETLRGYLLLIFISLVVFILLKNELGEKLTVENILLTMRNLKCKVYTNEILISELTKRQKEVIDKLGIIMPKNLGI